MLALILLAPTVAMVMEPETRLPRCSVRGRAVAQRVADLPAKVRAVLHEPMADSGQPFNASDIQVLPPLPRTRLICGFATSGDYVVEYERGGRGYHAERLVVPLPAGD